MPPHAGDERNAIGVAIYGALGTRHLDFEQFLHLTSKTAQSV